jgi:uncharacterized membrane protein required for colicin V production
MSVYLIFDLVILIALLAFAFRGAKRGLVLSLCGLVAVLVAFVGAGFAARTLSPTVAAYLEPKFAAAIEQRLDEGIQDAQQASPQPSVSPAPQEGSEPDGADGQAEASPIQDVLDALRDMGLYDTLIGTIDQAVSQGMDEAAASAAASVAAATAQSAAYFIIFVLAFILILLAWKLLSRALDLVARLPGLHFLNKTLGALFGLVQCCILLFVIAWFLQFFGKVIPAQAVNQTYLLKFFMTTNPFALLAGILG